VSDEIGPSVTKGINMKIIGFAGMARAGKTQSCDLLQRWAKDRGYRVMRMSFAGPLKRALSRAGITKDADPLLYRDVAQRWGSMRRDPEYRPGVTGPDYWVNKVLAHILYTAHLEHQDYLVHDCRGENNQWRETLILIDDIRYENECRMIKELNGTIVFVSAWDRLFRRGDKKEWDKESWRWHESEQLAIEFETGIAEDRWFDFVLVNDRKETDLVKSVPHYAPLWLDVSDVEPRMILS
jgi:hypothetical protein